MAARSLPQVIGIFGLSEGPDSPKVRTDATKQSIQRIYEGTYPQAQAAEPNIGDTFSDLPGTVVVVGSAVERLPGDKGRLTIDFETPYETTYECEWVEVDKALMENPRYWSTTVGCPSAGPVELTLQDRAMIERWEQEDDAAYKLAFQFKILQASATTGIGTSTPTTQNVTITGYAGTFNIYTLSSNAQDYAKKRLRGEESYRIYAPVVRQTSESLDSPPAGKCGVIETPPTEAGDVMPTGYQWQRSAKRVVRTGPYGKYRLQAEWQGAEFIDTDLYGTAGS